MQIKKRLINNLLYITSFTTAFVSINLGMRSTF